MGEHQVDLFLHLRLVRSFVWIWCLFLVPFSGAIRGLCGIPPSTGFIYYGSALSAAVMHLFIYVGVKWRFGFPISPAATFTSFSSLSGLFWCWFLFCCNTIGPAVYWLSFFFFFCIFVLCCCCSPAQPPRINWINIDCVALSLFFLVFFIPGYCNRSAQYVSEDSIPIEMLVMDWFNWSLHFHCFCPLRWVGFECS